MPAADLKENVRSLRKDMTDAELLLWRHLRRKSIGGLRFRRQVPLGPHIVDFVCYQARVAVEVDGGQHNVPLARRRDAQRDAQLAGYGYEVLRFWNHDVMQNVEGVAATIMMAVERRVPEGPHPSPNPLPQGEGAL